MQSVRRDDPARVRDAQVVERLRPRDLVDPGVRRRTLRKPGRAAGRPILMFLVYGVCLILVGVTASSQAALVSTNYQQAVLESSVQDDAGLVSAIVNTQLLETDLQLETLLPSQAAARQAALEDLLATMAAKAGIARVELRALDGAVIARSIPGSTRDGTVPRQPPDASMASAIARNNTYVSLISDGDTGVTGPPLTVGTVLREDLPLATEEAGVRAVVTIWRDAAPILAKMQDTRTGVVLLTLSAAAILAFVLYFVFKTAQDRISRQTAALVEATRRDAATGLLNHGAAVEALADAIEVARRENGTLAIALVDIDNFRLVNDTHGHQVGDAALTTIAGFLERFSDTHDTVIGRYGPDEFLLFTAGGIARLENGIRSVRDELADIALAGDAADAVPITISAGLCEFPDDGRAVTELLALVAGTLGEAKASGGDAVRIARADVGSSSAPAFDVLQGLVIAIDTKDRYTKRHSEDVARYGLFIADRMGLDIEARRTIRVAGLLHDVGKIGIPDYLLRKPGRLTESEYDIIKQHVHLGDMIVRDLPDIDTVRAGIRHHHERWDGRGYLHGLKGDDIPLVARILSVGDSFSAMTTSRPYRKALSVREAIVRLLDAAGTQLDEEVVRVFVDGIENAPDAPLPGSPMQALWTPSAEQAA